VKRSKKPLSETHPRLCEEWDYTKNGNLRPENVTYGANRKVWWVCRVCIYSWNAFINNRTKKLKPSGCPACSGRVVTDRNSLAVLHPYLLEEWDFDKNKLSPHSVHYSSGKKVWWRCFREDCGYAWESAISSRTSKRRPQKCPACNGRVANKKNNLAVKFPDLVKEWHPIKNGNLKPTDVVQQSHKKVWWECFNHHSWTATIGNRTRGSGCPYCAGKIVTDKNRLSIYFIFLYLKRLKRLSRRSL